MFHFLGKTSSTKTLPVLFHVLLMNIHAEQLPCSVENSTLCSFFEICCLCCQCRMYKSKFMQDQVWISIDDYVIQTYQGWYNIRTVINNATLNLTKETRKEIPQSVASNL